MNNIENSTVIGATEAYEREVLNEGVEPAPVESMSAEDWWRDAPDYLTNLNTEDMAKLREVLAQVMFWDEYMMPSARGEKMLKFGGNVACMSMEIAGLLIKSLERAGITRKQLEVEA